METTATLPSDRLSRGRLRNVPRRVPSPVTNGTPMGEPIWTWGVKAQAHVVALATDPGLCRRLRRLRLRSRPSSAPWFWPVPHKRATCGRRRKCAWLPFLRPAQSRRRRRASPRKVGGGDGADLKQLCFDLSLHMRRGIPISHGVVIGGVKGLAEDVSPRAKRVDTLQAVACGCEEAVVPESETPKRALELL